MEHQKIISLLDNQTQPSKLITQKWVKMNDKPRGIYSINSDIRFKTTILKSSLCDYSDTYILVKGAITITGKGADKAVRQTDERNKQVAFKNCAPFINWISEINSIQVDNAKHLVVVMPLYSLIEYSDNYSKTSGSL